MAPPHLRDRTDDELFDRGSIKIGKLLEVQAQTPHLVLAKFGQQGSVLDAGVGGLGLVLGLVTAPLPVHRDQDSLLGGAVPVDVQAVAS
jgi:hypothetical protein